MLDSIRKEEWAELDVLTGSAEHIPDAVIGLLSENRKKFDAAYWKIDNYAVVQGDLFSSAAVLPKYLALVVPRAKYKAEVVDLIWQIGTGDSVDTTLTKRCFSEAEKALQLLLKHPEIVSTVYETMIEAELKDMLEIQNARKVEK